MDSDVQQARTILQKELGFSLLLGESKVDRQGQGVFITDTVSKYKLVGLYPGQLEIYLS